MGISTEELEDVYGRRYAGFCRGATAILVDAEAAHDVVQEAFARALIERNRFRGGRPEAWVWRIVEREALRRRRAGRHLPLEDTFAPELIQDEHDPALVAAVRGLAPRRRLVVFLRYFADLS